ncbi:CoA transferase [Achromobacter denitrificans]|uniref:CoA transferase n=1 Tax=Achromobacter denitrificans TaxID=32002 RepID=A0A6N0JGP0_ACHDE|nr:MULTISPECIES: CoA transferase [Achromobacter]MBV2160614.1 CoA transferase [Achromobacter denitrificans]MDX3877576.1 CoA transferase [Achromobacter sp.]QKQ46255.1 CoA transferase [Achromobacter denitrificans]WFC69836.1 CoA transferase [Achromobacter denitrificans]
MTLPLSRIRVLDVSQIMAGPYCCMLLGDMGADVIKVETPGVGDQTRRAMGFKLKGEDSGGFIALNRNKRSVEIDLKNPQGLEAFYELVRSADVLVENNRPGVAARLKIDYPTLQAINPRLVYASISGFGQTGPWALRPGLDLIAQASCGAMSVMGEPGGEPMKSSVPFADLGAALFAAYAILSAVIGRGETGQGQYIDASLFETALGLSIWETAEFWGTGRVPSPLGSANRMSAPYQAIRAADRHLVIGAANPKLWAALCAVIERPDLLADPRFTDNVARLKNRKALIALLEQEFARRPAAEWVDLLLAAGVPAAPIQNYEEALDCEQARARDMVMEGEHPIEGKVKMLGFPVKLRGTPQQIRRVAPLLGAHTQEVFSELGLSAERIERLRAAGAFGARGKTAVPA